ncbi:hypothetical protein Cadr_000007434 [Camelus dromedarius]|uniref:Uncharacterized protein n=1 Tax=Camelus dromedarius TaxID=9838 RepID=A0A5N4E7I0_CAMDR|nr:hypothetical protein Cadr_000007434 [Camelus dromedarius]
MTTKFGFKDQRARSLLSPLPLEPKGPLETHRAPGGRISQSVDRIMTMVTERQGGCALWVSGNRDGKKGSSVAPCLSSGPNTLPSCSRAFPYTADLTSCLSPFPAYSSPNRGPLLEAASLTLPKTFTHRSLCLSGLSTGHHMASFFSLSTKMAVCDRPF